MREARAVFAHDVPPILPFVTRPYQKLMNRQLCYDSAEAHCTCPAPQGNGVFVHSRVPAREAPRNAEVPTRNDPPA